MTASDLCAVAMRLTASLVCHADLVQQPRVVFRPAFGRVLTVVVIALLLTAVGGFIYTADVFGALHFGPLIAFVGYGTWLLYWRPAVIVDSAHLVVINVGRTWAIPFTSLTAVETRYALAVTTTAGKVTAWAAPAPGRHQTLGLSLADFRSLRRGRQQESVRPGDAPNTESGSVAFVVRRRWQDALDNPSAGPAAQVTARWHVVSLAVTAVLLVLAVVGVATA